MLSRTSKLKPYLSIILVDGSFRENPILVDSLSYQTLPVTDYELIYVEYYSSINSSLQNKTQNTSPPLRTITLNRTGRYHSSFCFNKGIIEARGELIIIADADVSVEKDFLETIVDTHSKCSDLVCYVHRYDQTCCFSRKLPPVVSQPPPHLFHEAHPTISFPELELGYKLTNPNNYGGCVSVRKHWLLEINGYEQHAIFGSGFHANGLDVYTRLKNLGLHIMWHPSLKLFHPWHPHTGEGEKYWKAQKILIDYRAINRIFLPLFGIDPQKNSTTIPHELENKLNRELELLYLHD